MRLYNTKPSFILKFHSSSIFNSINNLCIHLFLSNIFYLIVEQNLSILQLLSKQLLICTNTLK